MLSEDDIQRYSRQILLPSVGGPGQERLLAAGVTARGAGPALDVALALLAAGGCAVDARLVADLPPGYLAAAGERGNPRGSLFELNAQAARPVERPAVCLGELPAAFVGEGGLVAMGMDGPSAQLVWCSSKGCRGCFEATAGGLAGPVNSALATQLGSLAAALVQQVVLGLFSATQARFAVEAGGAIVPVALAACGRCQAP